MNSIAILDDDIDFAYMLDKKIKEKFLIDIDIYNEVDMNNLLNPNLKLLFLDIDLGENDGIKVAEKMREQGSNVCIVFMSQNRGISRENPITTQSFFIRKTHLDFDLKEVFELTNIEALFNANMLEFINRRFDYKLINYIESNNHYIYFHTDTKVYKERINIRDVSAKLFHLGFIRVHRSYVVNISSIISVSKTEVLLKDGTLITIGKKYKNFLIDM